MANRRARSQVAANEAKAGGGDRELTVEDLLQYLVIPLPLPAFDVSGFAYHHDVQDSIQRLLIRAIKAILPDKILAIQFIFAKRSTRRSRHREAVVEGDFSFPLLLHCKDEAEALGISDGMAHVTQLLISRKSSFHVRVRANRLTYSPAVCVFSTVASDHIEIDFKSTTVLWIQLDANNDDSLPIRFPNNYIEDLGRRAYNGRHFYQADLQAAIDGGNFKESKIPADVAKPPLSKASARVGLVHESDITDESRGKRLQRLREELGSDVEYLSRVSYLLKFGDVILCTPHAYHDVKADQAENPINPHETITDSGLTVIVDRTKGKITEDDWLRIQVVAQKLAIFAGAAMSTATEARESILRTLHRGFNHEFRNAALSILSSLRSLTDTKAKQLLSGPDIDDIDGRLQFTKLYLAAAIEVYKQEHREIKKTLEELILHLSKYRDVSIETRLEISDRDSVMGLWQTVLIEILRNSYKHGSPISPGERQQITVKAASEGNHCLVTISNFTKDEEYKRKLVLKNDLDDEPEGWALITEMAIFLKGDCWASVDGNQVSIFVRMPIVAAIEG